MVDGYQGYNKVKENNRCCCGAHIHGYLLEQRPDKDMLDDKLANPASLDETGPQICNKKTECHCFASYSGQGRL